MRAQMQHYSLYILFGLITTLVNLIVYKVLIDLGIHYTISTTVAFVVAVSVAFWTNRLYVFRSQSQGLASVFREMTSFFSMRILTYLIDVVGLILLIELLLVDPFISKLLVNGLVVVLNYLLSRFVVFQTGKDIPGTKINQGW